MVDNTTPPANAIMGFAGWLTSRAETAGPFSETHEAAQMAQLVEEYCQMHGLTYDDTFSYRDDGEQDITPEGTPAGGMAPEYHIAWYFHDVMVSWAGRHTWLNYARACHEFPPSAEQLPKEFRDALLRLVAIWAER